MTERDAVAMARTRVLHPEPGRLWIRRAFTSWPGSEAPWTDLAAAAPGRPSERASLPAVEAVAVEGGLLYLPPVRPELEEPRAALAARLAGRGAEVLVQRLAGSRQAAPEGALEVIDPLPVLLARRWDDLALLPADTVVTWPLITGLTDDRDQWRLGCDALASAGVACVVAVVLEVAPRNRRRLLEQIEADDDGAFDRLFHGRAPDPRAFARTAAAANLEPFWRRRTTSRERSASNRQLAEVLALGAEIWLRLGRSESRGQELYASARRVDEASVHVAALAREGNASILPWLSVAALELVEEWSRTGGSATLDAWLAEYTRGGGEEVPGV